MLREEAKITPDQSRPTGITGGEVIKEKEQRGRGVEEDGAQ